MIAGAEQVKAEQDKAEQVNAEQVNAEQVNVGQVNVEQVNVGQVNAGQVNLLFAFAGGIEYRCRSAQRQVQRVQCRSQVQRRSRFNARQGSMQGTVRCKTGS